MPLPAFAGGWTQPEGSWYIAQKAFFYHNDTFFTPDGKRQSQPDYTKYELNYYAEYGLRDDLTLGANLFVHQVEQETVREDGQTRLSLSNTGLGDNELFVRWRVHEGEQYAISLQPLLKLPATYTANRLPRGGRKKADAELAAQLGYAFEAFGRSHYADARLGYRHRFGENINDQWRAEVVFGLNLNARWRFLPAIYTIWASEIPADTAFTQSGDNDFDLIKLEGAFEYQLSERLSLLFGAFSHVDGRNSGAGYGLFTGTGLRL